MLRVLRAAVGAVWLAVNRLEWPRYEEGQPEYQPIDLGRLQWLDGALGSGLGGEAVRLVEAD